VVTNPALTTALSRGVDMRSFERASYELKHDDASFVLAASNHGTMITNRFDYRMSGPHAGVGAGYQLLEAGAFDRG
jgi:hypothetical protein